MNVPEAGKRAGNGAGGDAPADDPRVYFAAERTFLAWIRTGIALMGFGFILARFGIFLEEIQAVRQGAPPQEFGVSIWFGIALLVIGVLINASAIRHHVQLVRGLRQGRADFARPSLLGIAVALTLAIVGFCMAVYLVLVYLRPPPPPPPPTERKPMETDQNSGIINRPSSHSVDATIAKLQAILQSKGVTVFGLVDHSGEAEKVGMKMRPTKLLIFGSPKAGTPLMIAAPSIAIDLPLKLLVWEDAGGQAWISFNSPDYLRERHHFPEELKQNIAVAAALADAAAA
jgi:uncharacterized protein (DUF302 family)/uncharacterized membrane protein YidH (DUF202 family)